MGVEAGVLPPLKFLDPHKQAAAGAVEVLTPGMRMIVASWMVEVAEEFRLQQETLHLAFGLLDRFLSSTQVCLAAFGQHGSGRLVCGAACALPRARIPCSQNGRPVAARDKQVQPQLTGKNMTWNIHRIVLNAL